MAKRVFKLSATHYNSKQLHCHLQPLCLSFQISFFKLTHNPGAHQLAIVVVVVVVARPSRVFYPDGYARLTNGWIMIFHLAPHKHFYVVYLSIYFFFVVISYCWSVLSSIAASHSTIQSLFESRVSREGWSDHVANNADILFRLFFCCVVCKMVQFLRGECDKNPQWHLYLYMRVYLDYKK